MKKWLTFSVFLFIHFTYFMVDATPINSGVSAAQQPTSAVNFTLDIEGEPFNDLQVTSYHGHPVQLFLMGSNEKEYRFDVLVHETAPSQDVASDPISSNNAFADQGKPKVYLRVHTKDAPQNVWLEKAAYEFILPYGHEVQFSTLSDAGVGITGQLQVSAVEN